MTDSPSILDALDTWSSWHADVSPLGATGKYSLDMLLADAFRALLYRPSTADRLDWLLRETCRATDDTYRATLCRWWLDISETESSPVFAVRAETRRFQCASS